MLKEGLRHSYLLASSLFFKIHVITTFYTTLGLAHTLLFQVSVCLFLIDFILVGLQCSIHVESLSFWTLRFSFLTCFEFGLSRPVCRLMRSREKERKEEERLDSTKKQH